MHDELVPGKKIAAYWVEYILRHGGTKHLETTSKNMPFIKYIYLMFSYFWQQLCLHFF